MNHSQSDFQAASIFRRLASLVYESLLIGAVSVVAAFGAGILMLFFPKLGGVLVAIMMLAAWWFYCRANWQHGETPAMRAWHLRLTDVNGQPPSIKHIRSRFFWSCTLIVFLPLATYGIMRLLGIGTHLSAAGALLWDAISWGYGFFWRGGFLYDHLADTRLMRIVAVKKNAEHHQ